MRDELMRALSDVIASGARGALATLVRTGGSTPQQVGARLLLCPDGRLVGTVGGGALEQQVIARLHACVAGTAAELAAHELGDDPATCCGGRMEVFVEPIEAQPRLWLCGAGHVGAAVAPLLARLGFAVTVIDARDALNTEARFPGLARLVVDPCAWLDGAALGGADWLLIATHAHALDEQLLERALARSPRYVGMLGSTRKVRRLLERIEARRGPLDLTPLHAPVGLGIGAVGPEEIAVSIGAELIALRRGVAPSAGQRWRVPVDSAATVRSSDPSSDVSVRPSDPRARANVPGASE